jgi:hypothetical protein
VLRQENNKIEIGTSGCCWCIGSCYKLFRGCEPCFKVENDKQKIQMENIRIMNLSKQPDYMIDYLRYKRGNTNAYLYDSTYCPYFKLTCSCSYKFKSEFFSKYIRSLYKNISFKMPLFLECEHCKLNTCTTCFGEYNEGHLCNRPDCCCNEFECDECKKNINNKRISEIKKQLQAINQTGQPNERKTFIMRCQVNECTGFLSQSYKCGICSVYTCIDCYMPKLENHECKPEDIASTKMIKQDTKPCPKCSARIYKIDGCDQMWCTDCRTAFSWRTGQIVNGNIHNPHYYDYLRNTIGNVPRAPGDNPCEDLIDPYVRRQFISRVSCIVRESNILRETSEEYKTTGIYLDKYIIDIDRYMGEVEAVYLENNILIESPEDNLLNKKIKENRILYLLKRISLQKFENDAFMYHQRLNQFHRFVELVRMLRQVLIDIFTMLYSKIEECLKLFPYEFKNNKRLSPEKIIERRNLMLSVITNIFDHIREAYIQIIQVSKYFEQQHTLNPYTKYKTDHYKIWTKVDDKKYMMDEFDMNLILYKPISIRFGYIRSNNDDYY